MYTKVTLTMEIVLENSIGMYWVFRTQLLILLKTCIVGRKKPNDALITIAYSSLSIQQVHPASHRDDGSRAGLRGRSCDVRTCSKNGSCKHLVTLISGNSLWEGGVWISDDFQVAHFLDLPATGICPCHMSLCDWLPFWHCSDCSG